VTGEVTTLGTEAGARVTDRPVVTTRAPVPGSDAGALAALRQHWPEYLIEGAGLGLFMVSACLFATLLEHPSSPARQTVTDAALRRIPMGLAMGLTAVAIIYSPWGQRSGAHLNPALTLTFWRLGKVHTWDAVFYVAAQFAGAIAGVGVAAVLLGAGLAHPAVNYAATVPGAGGAGAAFVAELLMTFVLMTAVLTLSNRPALNRFTGLCAGRSWRATSSSRRPWGHPRAPSPGAPAPRTARLGESPSVRAPRGRAARARGLRCPPPG
jgi:glycerol uptake facilitator-like aquaporin